MKPKTSFFNRGISRNLLRRCWPLWLCYGLLLLLVLSITNLAWVVRTDETREALHTAANMGMLYTVGAFLVFSAFMAMFTVRFLFGFLFDKRGSGMMASFPVRRESVFFTVWLTGLVPTLVMNLIWILLCYLSRASLGMRFSTLCVWMLATTCGQLCYYGLAVFCTMLTGSRVIYPLLYVLLNFGAALLEHGVQTLLDMFLYGYARSEGLLSWLSPPVKMIQMVSPEDLPTPHLEGLGVLVAYGAAGLLLSVLALLLYRKRHMETATDNIAVRSLKPVFKYGLSIGSALFAATTIYQILVGGGLGPSSAGTVAFLLLAGACFGYFAAEMLLHKSVRVFKGHWKGFAVVAAALLLFFCCAEFDLFGFEKRVPDPAEVEKVTIQRSYKNYQVELSQPESLELVRQAHQSYVDHKGRNDVDVDIAYSYPGSVRILYAMKDGRTITRDYPASLISWKGEENREELLAMQAVLSCGEAQEAFLASLVPPEGPSEITILIDTYQDGYWVTSRRVELFRRDYMDLYSTAILPDIQAHTLGRVWLLEEEGLELRTNVEILVYRDDNTYYSFTVCMDSENCLRWLKERGIEPRPLRAG